jgi:hypothetical protein
MIDRNGNPIWNPDFQLRKFCDQHSTKRIEIFPALDYNLYLDKDIDIYKFVNPNCDLILFDTSFVPNCVDQCYDWIKSLQMKHQFAYVTSNFSYHNSTDKNIVYFPFYYFQSLDNPTRQVYDIKKTRPYPIQCLNMNPWLHRTLNLIHMSTRSWFDQAITSFHWLNSPNGVPTDNLVNYVLTELTQEEKNILSALPLPITVTLPDEPDPVGWAYVGNASRAHELSYIDYITESGITEQFVSEKIWKPFFSGQLLLCLGPPGIIKHLNDLGLDTFNDIIDHQRYDNILGSSPKDIRDKISAILDIVDNLMCKDLDKIWQDTYERRHHNLQMVQSEEFKFKILDKLIKTIS